MLCSRDALLGAGLEQQRDLQHGELRARAFLRDAPLVLLDEPTAHLDPGTESQVIESLQRLCLGRTAIIASHSGARARLGRVLEIESGRAVGAPRVAQG